MLKRHYYWALYTAMFMTSFIHADGPDPERQLNTPEATHRLPFNPVGVWQAMDENDETEFLTLGPNGSAIRSSKGRADSTGKWEANGSNIVVEWKDGWVDVLTTRNGTITRSSYRPGTSPTGRPDSEEPLKRLDTGTKSKSEAVKAMSWGASIIIEQCDQVAGDID